MIATHAINTTLRWVGEYILLEAGLADFFGDVVGFRERLARGFVFDEFDAEQESEPADVADVRMRL